MNPLFLLGQPQDETLNGAITLNGVNQRRNFAADAMLGEVKEEERKLASRLENESAYIKSLGNEIDSVSKEIEELDESGDLSLIRREINFLKAKSLVSEREVKRRTEILREWMVSQVAMKNLFKKYGKLPDGLSEKDAYQQELASRKVKRRVEMSLPGDDVNLGDEMFLVEIAMPSISNEEESRSMEEKNAASRVFSEPLYVKMDQREKDALDEIRKYRAEGGKIKAGGY